MMKALLCLSVLLVIFTVSDVMALDLKPGKYEITTSAKMTGMPEGMAMGGSMPPMTATQCITEQNPVPSSSSANSGPCKVTNVKIKGNTATYNMECSQGGQTAVSKGKMSYHGDSFEGTTVMEMGPEAGGMSITSTIKAKRIGPCK